MFFFYNLFPPLLLLEMWTRSILCRRFTLDGQVPGTNSHTHHTVKWVTFSRFKFRRNEQRVVKSMYKI